jgi:two-component system chemotaxis response regulator CheB
MIPSREPFGLAGSRPPVHNRDIVVIGASAGGVQIIAELARKLPADLKAAVFVSIHVPANAPSGLPTILNREGPLLAVHAVDGEPIQTGRIYIAPPDRHLLIHPGTVRLGRGPRENGHRPAVDPLFRTAARAYGARVIGVILTGNLSDGTAGLIELKRAGGIAVVQEPTDAVFDGMPRSAIDSLPDIDYTVRSSDLADLLIELVAEAAPAPAKSRRDISPADPDLAEGGAGPLGTDEREEGHPSVYGCPDCGGVLWEKVDGQLLRYRCRVGHAFTPESLLDAQTNGLETALWAALRALSEMEQQARGLADRMQSRGHARLAERFIAQAEDAAQRASVIRLVLVEPGASIPNPEGERAALDEAG